MVYHLVEVHLKLLQPLPTTEKKADAVECLGTFDRVGLLVNEPPGPAELLFI
jgi:hypothetical protein